jgi:hypothetical protein
MCLGAWIHLGYVKDTDIKAVVRLPEVPDNTKEEDLAVGWDTISNFYLILTSTVVQVHDFFKILCLCETVRVSEPVKNPQTRSNPYPYLPEPLPVVAGTGWPGKPAGYP